MFNLSEEEFIVLRDIIKKECGISIGDEKAYLIESKLSSLLVENMCFSFKEFCELLSASEDNVLIDKVVDQITINETLWFRDVSPWDMLDSKLLNEYVESIRKNRRKIRIWSAASSSGQEPYSIAITIQEFLDKNGITDVKLTDFDIIGTDICKSVLSIAKNGKYDSISMRRGMPDDIKEKYFHSDNGRIWELNDNIKSSVKFKQFNLMNSFQELGKFDLVLCRYVLIYFTKELKLDIMKKIHKQLQIGGCLFVGGGEIFVNGKEDYETVFVDKTVYYIKKGEI